MMTVIDAAGPYVMLGVILLGVIIALVVYRIALWQGWVDD